MQVKSSELPQPGALVNPHSSCASISIHATWEAKDLIRAVLLFLLPLGLALMAPIALHAQAVVSFTGVQSTVGSGLNYANGVAVDAAGDVFIADTWNNRLVKVPAGCISPA